MPATGETELTGRLKAGRHGFFLEDANGVRWALKIDRSARDFLGQQITVIGHRSAKLVDVHQYTATAPDTL
ncbi:DUF5818 domain-containing protein [Sphingomonas sp. SUN039]|uniref:DUF5818 domain-containing protein n=1 Tax=Sphingomonas sp. SUN039 TaxID=2937787 RepID=UPI00216447B3|nr:DUF5818 domain-containing protein [Sphingomonas sp. SUN039]UVO53786.1 DUF5818 domain-containing protein [Sphingomonas sp. SUN039]